MTRKVKEGVITMTYSGAFGREQEPEDLPTFEKQRDLAIARVNYALQRQNFWNAQVHHRMQEVHRLTISFMKAKHGFTEEELKCDKSQTYSTWDYLPQPSKKNRGKR